MTYKEYNKQKQEAFNNLPIKFAFGEKSFYNMLKEFGLTLDNFKENLRSIGAGGYILKKDISKLTEWRKEYNSLFNSLIQNDNFLAEMFEYEFQNHECQISYEWDSVLEMLFPDLSEKTNEEYDRIMGVFEKAKQSYWEKCLKNDWF